MLELILGLLDGLFTAIKEHLLHLREIVMHVHPVAVELVVQDL